MEIINNIFGLNAETLMLHQILIRAFTVYFASLIFIRIAGIRTLGSRTTFDYITYVMLGAILGRAVVTANQPFFSSLAAVLLLVLLQRLLAWCTFKSHKLGNLIKGSPIELIKEKEIVEENLRKTHLTKEDLYETLHLVLQSESFNKIRNAYLERSGDISIITAEEK